MSGNFDTWVITVDQNTLSIPFEISFSDQYFIHAHSYLINWTSIELGN